MIIKKILNNNFAIVQVDNNEMVVMGLGLAFQKKVGDFIESYEIEKSYLLETSEYTSRLLDIIVDVPFDIFLLSEKIFEMIKSEIGKRISNFLFIALTDHIHSVISRYNENISIPNSLLPEIQKFYPVEYLLGLKTVEIINQSKNIELDLDEAGFIALHIVNATMEAKDTSLSYNVTNLVKQILNLVKNHYVIDYDINSLYYYRFISHLRLLGQRIFTNQYLDEMNKYDELLSLIKDKYSESYQTSLKISEYIFKVYDIKLFSEELMYLTIHIERIINEIRK